MAEPVVPEVAEAVLPPFDLHEMVRRIAERLQVDEDTASLLMDRQQSHVAEDLELETA
ncbi:MAG: hypothetical protein QOH84_3521 [Kribbellaceae bacterium]|jgi:hypothetical protein|nr:hypothetical protein [Kribbellaceae bacterium]